MTLKPPSALTDEFTTVTGISDEFTSKVGVHLDDYLPDGFVSGVTDCTAAITAWGVAAQGVGTLKGGVVMGASPGVYKFTPSVSGVMITLTSISVKIDAEGATFADQLTYTGTQTSRFVRYVACVQVRVKFKGTSQFQTDAAATGLPPGMIWTDLRQGTTVDTIDLTLAGGREGITNVRASTDPDSYKTRGGIIKVHTSGIPYPYVGSHSGCEQEVWIDSSGSARDFIIYGVENLKIHVRSRDQVLTSNLSGFNSKGCSDIEIWYYDRESTTNTFGISMMWRRDPSTLLPVAMRNITIHYDMLLAGTDARALILQKDLTDTDTTDDSTARGHILDGLTVDGYLEYTGASVINLINHGSAGELVVGDFMRNINFEKLVIKDAGTQRVLCNFNAKALLDVCRVTGLTSTSSFKVNNQANGKVIYTSCIATHYSTDATDQHLYIGCSATGASQTSGTSKRAISSTGTNLGPPFSVTAAATLVIPDAPLVIVTGNTNITAITARVIDVPVTLKFSGTPTVSASGTIKLVGGVNFVATADDTLTLMCDGTTWWEVARSVNA